MNVCFLVSGLVSSVPSQEISLEERLVSEMIRFVSSEMYNCNR